MRRLIACDMVGALVTKTCHIHSREQMFTGTEKDWRNCDMQSSTSRSLRYS
jgi:hypothetical protein